MRKRQNKKIWNNMADGREYKEKTIFAAQVKDGIKCKCGKWKDWEREWREDICCPVCGSAYPCTCGGTGLPHYYQ